MKNKVARQATNSDGDDQETYLSSLTNGLDQVSQAANSNAPLSPKVIGSKDKEKLSLDRDLNSGVALSS